MADLQKALDWARNNPNDERSKKLLDAVASGKITSDAVQAKTIQQEHSSLGENIVDFAKGFGRGVLQTANNMAVAGEKVLGPVVEKITGSRPDMGNIPQKVDEIATPTNTAQKIGKGAEQVAEFFTPVGLETKAASVAGKVGKVVELAKDAVKTGVISGTQEGNIKDGGIDALVSLGLGGIGNAATRVLKPLKEILSQKVSGRIMNEIIKPGINDFSFGKDPGMAVVNEGLSGKTLKDLFSKISERKKKIGSAIEAEISKVNESKIDLGPIFSSIDESISKATDQGEQALVTRLQSIKDGLTKTFKNENGKLVETGSKTLVVSPIEAWKIKKSIGEAAKWTGQAFDTEANKVRVDLYRAISGELEKLSPALKGLNKRYAGLLTAQKAAERRINTVQRQNKVGLGDLLTLGAGGLGGGVVGAATLYGAKKALDSTLIQSNLAKFFGKIDPNEKTIIEKYLPQIGKIYFGAVDNEK